MVPDGPGGHTPYFRILDHELEYLFDHDEVYVVGVSEMESDPDIEWIELRWTPHAHLVARFTDSIRVIRD